jgi:hypothetical protein
MFTDEAGVAITVQEQTHRIERSEQLPVPCSFASFIEMTEAPVTSQNDRREAWDQAYTALGRMRGFWSQIPPRLPEAVWGYIKKYSA